LDKFLERFDAWVECESLQMIYVLL
jgi:hypothetical protein